MKYFTLEELYKSATAARLGINNKPNKVIQKNLEDLVNNILDPIRQAWGAPIIVTSGYRSALLNKAIGGSKTSQHMKGQAADIRTVSDTREDNMKLLKKILELNLPFDQIISEYIDAQNRPDWIHISYSPSKRKMKLTCKNGKYFNGIKV